MIWLVALSAVLVLVLLGASGYAAAQPLIIAEWGISGAEAGFIFAAHQLGYVAGTLVVLPLTDRFDARRLLVTSAAAAALANLAFPFFAHDVSSAAVLRAAAGLGLVGVYMPGIRLVAERFPGWRGGAVGTFVAAFYLGVSLALAATGALLPSLGWRGALLAIGLAGVSAPLLALALLRHQAPLEPGQASGRLDLAVLTNRPAMLVVLAYAAHSWELYAAWAWLAPYLSSVLVQRSVGVVEAASLAGAAVGLASAPNALGVALGGALSDRLGRARSAGAILGTSALGSLAIGWLGWLPWPALVGLVVIYTLLLAADSAIYSAAITELARPGQLGATQAVQAFIGFSATVLAPVACGLVLDLSGPALGWGLGFGQAGLIALLGVACLAAVPRPRYGGHSSA